MNYITKENITFILAIIGSLGTIYTLISQRKKLSLSIQEYRYHDKTLLMFVSFANHSHLPISILNIAIVHDKVCYPCVYIPTVVCQHTHRIGKEVVNYREDFSIQFPIVLSSLAGSSGYLYFDKLPDIYPDNPTALTVQVSTNRGKAKKMILSVPNL